jgi:polar amino acid transport system permease protein
MQLVFWGLVSVLWPTIVFGIPIGPTLFEVATSSVFSVGVCAVVGLSLNEAAYLSEIVRSGFASVDPGQIEAAASLGMSRNQIFTRITLPQALRIIVPPIGNETIAMLKTTSLVLAVPFAADLMFVTRSIGARLFLPIPLIITGAIWYLACTSILMLIQSRVEKHFGKGYDLKIKHSNQLTEIPSSTAHV